MSDRARSRRRLTAVVDWLDGVSLDDPDFWLKLMPEAAAAEEERKAEAEKLLAQLQAAEQLALEEELFDRVSMVLG